MICVCIYIRYIYMIYIYIILYIMSVYIYILDSIRTPHMQSQSSTYWGFSAIEITPRRGSVVGAHQASGGEVDVLFEICYIINKHIVLG